MSVRCTWAEGNLYHTSCLLRTHDSRHIVLVTSKLGAGHGGLGFLDQTSVTDTMRS